MDPNSIEFTGCGDLMGFGDPRVVPVHGGLRLCGSGQPGGSVSFGLFMAWRRLRFEAWAEALRTHASDTAFHMVRRAGKLSMHMSDGRIAVGWG